MESDDIYSQMKAAKAEMDRAQAEMLRNTLDDGSFRKFVEARKKYWELADEWLAESLVKSNN